ncbi:MAG: site-2 protease family protein [Lysobacteraceae bacterium]
MWQSEHGRCLLRDAERPPPAGVAHPSREVRQQQVRPSSARHRADYSAKPSAHQRIAMSETTRTLSLFPPEEEDVSQPRVAVPRRYRPVGFPVLFAACVVTGIVIGPLFVGYLPRAQLVAMVAEGGWLRLLFTLSMALGTLWLSATLHLVFHELGHMAFGTMCGMRPRAICFGPYLFVRHTSGWRQHPPMVVKGIGGFAMMLPHPDRAFGNGSMVLFVLGGAAMNLFLAIAGFVVLQQLTSAPAEMRIAVALFALLGVLFAAMSLTPRLSHGWMTDGRWLLETLHGTEQSRILRESMRISALSMSGVRPSAWPTVLPHTALLSGFFPVVAMEALGLELLRSLDRGDRARADVLAGELRGQYVGLSVFHRTYAALWLAVYAADTDPSPELLAAWIDQAKGDTILPVNGLRFWLAAELAMRRSDPDGVRSAMLLAHEALRIESDSGETALIVDRLDRLQKRLLETQPSHPSH